MTESKDLQSRIAANLERYNLTPNTNLGQHFLIEPHFLEVIADQVNPGGSVLEIGPGPGQLTEVLAGVAAQVLAIEIDRRYSGILSDLVNFRPNVHVVYEDAIKSNWASLIGMYGLDGQALQIISSLPYQITEPFLHKVAGMSLENIILVAGESLGKAARAQEGDGEFGQRSLLMETFFDVEILETVPKKAFWPIPKTESVILKLTPKSPDEIRGTPRSYIFQRLFKTSSGGGKIKNLIKEALIEFTQPETLTQNQARQKIEALSISESLLEKSFEQLNSAELSTLSTALRLI